MSKVAKVIFSDINATNIKVSFVENKRIIAPRFNGIMDCTIIEDNDMTTSYKGVFDEITEEIKKSDYATKGRMTLKPTEYLVIPKMNYSDITEMLVINSGEIMEGKLASESEGMLAFYGTRILQTVFSGDFKPILDPDSQLIIDNEILTASLKVDSADGKMLDDIICFDGNAIQSEENKRIIMFDVDTNQLGRVFESEQFRNRENVTLNCTAEIKVSYISFKYTIEYPVRIALINTMREDLRQKSRKEASIDFGTTSTCVAVETPAGPELLTISASSDNSENKYENPTNLMIFNWENLYRLWIKDNCSVIPTLYKGNRQDFKNWDSNGRNNIDRVDFDFGYPVRNELGAQNPIADSRTINSILSLIKMIPYQVIHDEKEIKFSPFGDPKKFIYITADCQKQDIEHFDPVAFYGYLIGRAINDRSRRPQIHTRFTITSPVKFDPEVKNSIKASLEYGLSRTVPEPMKDHVHVNMKYDEPVAYIGAICGTDYFKVDNTTEKFAVYDFGGGTLDFSFGEVTNDEDGETSIKVLMVGGRDNIGGESLIHRMTFRIYCENYTDQMKNNDIPIEKPVMEPLPDYIEDYHISTEQYSNANVNIINYAITRRIFEGSKVENKKVSLYDRKGDTHEITLTFDDDALRKFLRETISESIGIFRNEMLSAFDCIDGCIPQDVNVFLAGNSSKNEFVMPCMKEILGSHITIKKPDDLESEPAPVAEASEAYQTAGRRKRGDSSAPVNAAIVVDTPTETRVKKFKNCAITPKTAVALGQLNLNNFNIEIDTESFKWYAGFFNSGNGKFMGKLNKGDSPSDNWVKFKKITNSAVDVYYSDFKPQNGSISTVAKITLQLDGLDGKILFVRIKDQNTIEYCIGDNDNQLSIPTDAVIRTLSFSGR